MPKGTVKWFNAGKNYGFIVPDSAGEDVFFHASALGTSQYGLEEGQRVDYEMGTNKGKTCAVSVRINN